MKVILQETVEKLGEKGEVKEVKKGYFKNFLYPRNLAKIATPDEITRLEKEAQKKLKAEAKKIKKLEKNAQKLKSQTTKIEARLIGGRKIFGSIKGKQIAEVLGLKAKQIKIKEPIKEAGKYKIKINLGKGITTETTIEIVSKKKRK